MTTGKPALFQNWKNAFYVFILHSENFKSSLFISWFTMETGFYSSTQLSSPCMTSFTNIVAFIWLILSKSDGGEISWINLITSFIEIMNPVEKRSSVPEGKSKILQFYHGWPGLAGAGGESTGNSGVKTPRQICCPLMSGGCGAGRCRREVSEWKSTNAHGNKLQQWIFKEWLLKLRNGCKWILPLSNIKLHNFWVKADVKYNCQHWPMRWLVHMQTDHSSRSEILPCWTQWPISIHPGAGCHRGRAWQWVGGWVCSPAMLTARGGCVRTPVAQSHTYPWRWKCQP